MKKSYIAILILSIINSIVLIGIIICLIIGNHKPIDSTGKLITAYSNAYFDETMRTLLRLLGV